MARVHLLDDELINKIAAGEVVERPASVVKELVENAIDAGATHIRVSLKDGGRQLIHVQDDGCGLEPEDARLAVKRHTTSKLTCANDLFSVASLGFRGEALASISSVSRFTLQTQARSQSTGVRLTLEEGQIQEAAWQGPQGTSVIVSDLFYNVPARKAFLKTPAAEFAACHEYMQALALSLPHIGFTLLHNDREVFNVGPWPGSDTRPRGEPALRRRALDLFGEELVSPLIYTTYKDRYAEIEALLSPPGHDRGSAKHLFTFVNQRWVRDKLIRFGVMRGYHSHLLKGKFPIVCLHLDLDPGLVDVNVHPAKAELRFQYGQEVQNALALAIRNGLRQAVWAGAPSRQEAAAIPSPGLTSPAEGSPLSAATPRVAPPVPVDFDLLLGKTEALASVAGSKPLPEAASPVPEPSAQSSRDAAQQPAPASPTDALASFVQQLQQGAQQLRREQEEVSRPGATRGEPEAFRAPLSPPQQKVRSAAPADTIRRTTMSFDAPQTSERSRVGADFALPPSGIGSTAVPLAQDTSSQGDARWERSAAPRPAPRADAARWVLPKEVQPPLEADGRLAATPFPLEAGTTDSVSAAIPWGELRYVGAFARCYLLFEYRQQLLIVDQHAFHERILYERLSRNPDLLNSTQPLLMPEVLAFSPTELVVLQQQQDLFARFGLHYQAVSETELEVTAVPSLMVNRDLGGLLQALLDGVQNQQELAHDVLATMACHAAVRAGEELPDPELASLLREAQHVDFYHNCPHGRRVFRWWKESQVAAWFDRLS